MPHLLIVDDEQSIRAGFREYAEFLGFTVDEAADGMEAVQLCREQDYDLVVMDIMMPRLDGFTAVKQIRRFKDVPILVLTARDEEYDKLHGFDLGIDDYVTKPFSARELLARIQAIINRSTRPLEQAAEHKTWRHLDLMVDMTAREVTIDHRHVDLTPKECELLFYLIDNRSVALSRQRLLEAVWGYDFFGDDRTVDTHIKTLRMKLGTHKDCIVTLRGHGYRFEG
ncbi:MAG: response regulator transcription factor [Propionibacteriaceae bacterium]|nr:response regulator transcription factor [Propionibacteriaceae bacterium]